MYFDGAFFLATLGRAAFLATLGLATLGLDAAGFGLAAGFGAGLDAAGFGAGLDAAGFGVGTGVAEGTVATTFAWAASTLRASSTRRRSRNADRSVRLLAQGVESGLVSVPVCAAQCRQHGAADDVALDVQCLGQHEPAQQHVVDVREGGVCLLHRGDGGRGRVGRFGGRRLELPRD